MIFNIGAAIDLLVLLFLIYNSVMMNSNLMGISGAKNMTVSDMPAMFTLALWMIPVVLACMIAIAFGLKMRGKMLSANILLWIPALPLLTMIVLWGGLALIFILFSK